MGLSNFSFSAGTCFSCFFVFEISLRRGDWRQFGWFWVLQFGRRGMPVKQHVQEVEEEQEEEEEEEEESGVGGGGGWWWWWWEPK